MIRGEDLNTRNDTHIPPLPQTRTRDYIFIFENLELAFKKTQLSSITKEWNGGKSIEELSETHKRAEIEILLALLFQAMKNRVKRPFAYRIKEEN